MAAQAKIDIVLSNGQQAGKTINELTAQTAKLAREIKKMDENSDEFIAASEDFKKVDAKLKEVRKSAFQTAEAQGFLNSTFGDMIPFQGHFGKLSQGIRISGTALKGAAGMAQLFKIALASTGIGLVVVALGALYTWLNKTQQGMDFVGKVTKALSATFNVIIDRVLAFGGALMSLLKGDVSGAVDGLKNTFGGLGKELVTETKAAYQMEGAMQDIVRAEKDLELQRSRSRAEIEKLKMAAEDQTKSESERLANAQKAYDMEQKLLGESIALQEKKLALINAENDLGTSTDEDLNRAKDVEIELNNMREESFTKQTELQNKVNELKRAGSEKEKALIAETLAKQKEAAEEKKKKDEEAAKAEEELRKKLLDAENTLKDLRVGAIQDEQDQKIAQLMLGYERELAAFAGSEEQKKEFMLLKQAELDAAMSAVEDEFRKKAQEKALADLESANEAREAKIWEQFYNNQITEEERNALLYEQAKAAIEGRLALLVASGATETAQYQELYTQLAELHYNYETEKTNTAKEENEKRIAIQQAGLKAAADVFGGFASLLESDEKNRKKNIQKIKLLKKAELSANLPLEISNIWTQSSQFGPIAGPIIAAFQTGLALLRFGKGMGEIDKIQYAKGGPVFGPSHAGGGIPFGVKGSGLRHEMEGNEIILSKGVYQNPVLRTMASELNVLGGGRSFALGGPVLRDRPMVNPAQPATGTVPGVANAIANAGSSGAMDMSMTNELLARIAEYTRMQAEKPPLVLTEIEAKLNQLEEIRNDASL